MPMIEAISKDHASQLSDLPFSGAFLRDKEKYHFDEWYPRMGGSCSLNSLYSVEVPRCHSGSDCIEKDKRDELKTNGIDTTLQDERPRPEASMDDVPDVILIEIFRLIHPIDRIHSVSLVCERWNRLLYASNVWTDVRVLLSPYSIATRCAERFLARIANSVKKLCLRLVEGETGYPKAQEVIDTLPNLFPQLNLLDIGYFPGLTPDMLTKIDACMPNLQRLNMEHAFSASCCEVLFSGSRLVNVCELVLCGWGFTAHKIETLFHVRTNLEVLNADEASMTTGMHSRNWKGFDEVIPHSPLKRLYVRGFFRPSTLLKELHSFTNLTLLSISYSGFMGPNDILPIKRLSGLSHLHLSGNYDDYSRMTAQCLSIVFGSTDRKEFPYKLKFLSLPDWLQLDDGVVEQIALNCTQLRSLSIARCPLVTKRGFSLIAKSLRELRFLDVNEIADTLGESAFVEISAKDLPSLIYLSAHCKQMDTCSEELRRSLERLVIQRPMLMVSEAVDSFITFKYDNGRPTFNDSFNGNVGKIANELARLQGFCCMSKFESDNDR